jgi:hypothetical protein
MVILRLIRKGSKPQTVFVEARNADSVIKEYEILGWQVEGRH